jgi:uncharacterized protein (TIGR02145 family)
MICYLQQLIYCNQEKSKMKKLILFVTLLTIIMIQFAFTQSMNVFTKSGSTSYKLSDIDSITFLQPGGTTTGTVTDIDGNVYKTVTIGTQVWMAENLKTTKYRNGDAISYVTDDWAWMMLTAQTGAVGATGTGGYCNYANNTSNGTTYGRLYNGWVVADSRKIAPAGWHVPTDAEWTTLTTYLGGESTASKKLKETGTSHWSSPNSSSTNETGFTALPSGSRGSTGSYYYIGDAGDWWSSTEYVINGVKNAYYRYVVSFNDVVTRAGDVYGYGFSIRCIKD